MKDATVVSFRLGESSTTRVSVRDGADRLVRTLGDGVMGPGPISLSWDGRDAAGTTLPDGRYRYAIDATDAAGNGTSRQGETTVDTTAPAPPTRLAASDVPNDSGGALSLRWDASPATDVAAYCVLRRPTVGVPEHSLVTAVDPGVTTYTDADPALANGTSYSYILRPVDHAGNLGAPSNEASATPVDNRASAPDTAIVAAPPPTTTSSLAEFRFTATEAGASFECRLDDAEFVACTIPQVYSSLSLGRHTFSVRAKGSSGAVDPTAATFSWEIVASDSPIPPDPAIVAPPVPAGVATNLADASAFLYTGANPIQAGVAPGTMVASRVAVLKGRVLNREGGALTGADVAVAGHPEFGRTRTRADGAFDLAVNGGGMLTIDFHLAGFVSAQRKLDVPWQEHVAVPDVVLVPIDVQVTQINLSDATQVQVARGSPAIDDSGTRQATVLFEPGTRAEAVLPDGTPRALTTLNVRATEFTVGASGTAAMPAALPPASAYTYAVELSVDEVPDGDVRFERPVPLYVENFVGFPVGIDAPLGYYDRTTSRWVAADSGRVVKLIGVTDGRADLDVDGSGSAAAPQTLADLGVTDAERQRLATLYAPGQSLWRVRIPHFSAWDINWGIAPPPDAEYPPDLVEERTPTDDPCERQGSVIECQNQVLRESIPVVGTPHGLNYRSDSVPGMVFQRTLEIPLTKSSISPLLEEVQLEISVAGRTERHSFDPAPSLSYTFVWDGTDGYGRTVYGRHPVMARIGYRYRPVYASTSQFGYNGSGGPVGTSLAFTRPPAFILSTVVSGSVSLWDSRQQGLGGWTLDVHHAYDVVGRVLHLGTGKLRTAAERLAVEFFAGGGACCSFNGEDIPAKDAFLSAMWAMTVAPDGTVYIPQRVFHRVRAITPEGIVRTVAGTGEGGFGGDGWPARQALLSSPSHVALGPDGTLYVTDLGNRRLRAIAPDGTIRTVAGTGQCCDRLGNGGPALQAQFGSPAGLAVGPDGTVYVGDADFQTVRAIGSDGTIRHFAGTGWGYSGDGGPAADAALRLGFGALAVGPDGSLYIADSFNHRVRAVRPSGTIVTVAGDGTEGSGGDGLPAVSAALGRPGGVAVAPDGTVYVSEETGLRVRAVRGGIITTVAGSGVYGGWIDGALAPATTLTSPAGLAVTPSGLLLAADNSGIAHIRPLLPRFGDTPGSDQASFAIASEDAVELYIFDSRGRHLRTVQALTGADLWRFEYAPSGGLAALTDGDGNRTMIERDGSGKPTAVVGPFGQRTALALDSAGLLQAVTKPANETVRLTYEGGGLLATLTTARDQTYRFSYNEGLLVKDEDPAGGFISFERRPDPLLPDEPPGTPHKGFSVVVRTAEGMTMIYSIEHLPNGSEKRINAFPDGTRSELSINADGTRNGKLPDGTVVTQLLGPDPRWGMHAPVVRSESTTTPGGLTRTVTLDPTAELSNPSDKASLIRLTEMATVNGRVHRRVYEAATRTLEDTTPAGRSLMTLIDPLGRVIQSRWGDLFPVRFTYDSRGRPTRVAQGDGTDDRVTSLTYNAAGYTETVTDPLGRQTAFVYDGAGRVTQQSLPGEPSRVVRLGYDANGNQNSVTPPGRPVHTFTHTPVDLEESYTPPDVVSGPTTVSNTYDMDRGITRVALPTGQQVTLDYDTAGRLGGIAFSRGGLSYKYDPAGRLSTLAAPDGVTLGYTYDGALVTAESWSGPVAGTVGRTFDNDFRPITQSVANTAVGFAYDPDGLLTQAAELSITRDPQTGLLASSTARGVTDVWTYNGFGEPTGYRAEHAGNVLFQQDFVRDKLGRITKKTELGEGVTTISDYSYDAAGRLAEVKRNGAPVATYTYDANGNRLSATTGSGTVSGSYDNQDRLSSYGDATYEHNAIGQLTDKTAGGHVTAYAYDEAGNLLSVGLPDGTAVEYLIDGQNRRVGRKVNGTLMQGFLWDGQLRPVAETDGSGAVVARFVYGTRPNVPEYLVKGGVTYRIVTDHLGSPRLVVNAATGEVVQRMEHDDWGNITLDTDPSFQPFGFAGGLWDRQTGLVRFGARDYDPSVGRWTARDPIGFAGGSANLYRYVDNNPHEATDATGLAGWLESYLQALEREAQGRAESGQLALAIVQQSGIEAIRLAVNLAPIWGSVVGGVDTATDPTLSWCEKLYRISRSLLLESAQKYTKYARYNFGRRGGTGGEYYQPFESAAAIVGAVVTIDELSQQLRR